MKRILIIIISFYGLSVNGQNYLISFAGTGASTTVSSVKVENLTAGTTLTLNGSDILSLTITTGVNSAENNQSPELKIYPNPMTDNSTIEISSPVAEDATISVYDMTGKLLTQIQSNLDKGLQEFHLSGLRSGSYLISAAGSTYHYSGKLLCNSKSDGTISIEKISNNQAVDEKKVTAVSKGAQAIIDMAYTTGDRLKFTGISGIYSTVKTDIPSGNKTITFNFILCTDGDNNNYSIVEIGSQVWMAENLKTTKFNDGSAITLVADNTEWGNLTSPGYCWFNNDVTHKEVYGALYNWYALDAGSNDGKNVCPASWHVPFDEDWNTLTSFLGGETVAGGKMKETGLAHWYSPNTGATNESGFSALPGSFRYSNGGFDAIGTIGFYWSAKENISSTGWNRAIYSGYPDIYRMEYPKKAGFSVRCLKD